LICYSRNQSVFINNTVVKGNLALHFIMIIKVSSKKNQSKHIYRELARFIHAREVNRFTLPRQANLPDVYTSPLLAAGLLCVTWDPFQRVPK
jgi:hypothetical protein